MSVSHDRDYDDGVSREGKKTEHEEGPVHPDLQLAKGGEAPGDNFQRVAQICHDPGVGPCMERKEDTKMERQR